MGRAAAADRRRQAGARDRQGHLLGVFAGKVPKWWLPDDVVVVAELPHTATGKVSKLTLRQRFRRYLVDSQVGGPQDGA